MNERNENNQNMLEPKGGIQEGASEYAGEKLEAAGGFGQLLRAERLKRGLSINEVARRLHLSAQQIHAIEEEDFSKLPSGTYLRGFIKNYSNLLQLDTNAMLRLLTQSAPVASRQSILKSSSTVPLTVSKRSYSGRRGLGTIMVLILALLGYGVYQGGDWDQESVTILKEPSGDLSNSQTEHGQVTMELLLPQSSLAPLPSLEKQPVPETRSPEFGIAPTTPSVIEPPVVESPVSSDKTLHLSFSKDSWVEIRDSDKKVIFVKTNPKGTEQVITGVPPFYLVIGNASGVNLTYNGRSVDMTPYTRKSDDVARFSLE
ncbi:MAG TPA: helix-turn-helix domain-containing protein [Nitrosomonas nitrosa]|jgi:cytoskeleton protein RodZ|uniref:Cytoskeleton protein RodZ n=1 Tax=Nitrosomonas nitrosa TaxID=52442 RepID=A0A1I4N1W9_9PROT|nr:RodZ domain-containing protein [Nitrosomonas nitrosa]MCO6433835.1 helix-turn-helix domain-containing protein [Nitrosomonas nitrosa]PTQ96193.1 cytoskeleton protein RodZ [Nitrosomonas nitrosa]CAE6489806.1 Cytoskeleton protein RodZ [Nitrosomonas nitrosa]SFM09316.1 cytoskeleton protein RodZ [Nitrosomonas nitrosa]HBZ30851.1 helix-turn-helix domain-containing protein [Nitrosomonas nitrosa]